MAERMPGPAFDGDAFLAALQRPTLTLGGRTYTGRLLSLPEYLRFQDRLTGAGAGIQGNRVVDPRRFAALVRELTTAIYGRGRPWWAVWRPTVAAQLARTPLAVQVEALLSFSRSQTERFVADAERLTKTAGTTSDPPTPPAT